MALDDQELNQIDERMASRFDEITKLCESMAATQIQLSLQLTNLATDRLQPTTTASASPAAPEDDLVSDLHRLTKHAARLGIRTLDIVEAVGHTFRVALPYMLVGGIGFCIIGAIAALLSTPAGLAMLLAGAGCVALLVMTWVFNQISDGRSDTDFVRT